MVEDDFTATLKEVAGLLVASARPCVFTGAGMSQESGIPTYRDETNGLWRQYNINEVSSGVAFHTQPQKVWDFHMLLRDLVQSVQPNPGHIALADIEADYLSGLPIITQNIDDLHERAGSRHIVHLHGQLMRNRCSRYCLGIPSIVEDELIEKSESGQILRCPHCDAYLRPDIILYGEYLHGYVMDQARTIASQTDLMIVIGTSGLVAPASEIPLMARDSGATLIEINLQPSRITGEVDVFIPLPVSAALSSIRQTIAANL